LHLVVIII